LAELAAHQRVVAAAEARPVFLSKAARQAAALERLAARRAAVAAGGGGGAPPAAAAAAAARPPASVGAGGRPGGVPTRGAAAAASAAAASTGAGLTDAERAAIRRHYLREADGEGGRGGGRGGGGGVDSSGATAARRRLAGAGGGGGGGGPAAAASVAGRASDKARFRFEWDASEDTAGAEVDPMYADAAAAAPRAALLFGRARPAGYLSDEDGGGGPPPGGRPAAGAVTAAAAAVAAAAARRPRRPGGGRAADDARHWSAKAVDEMTERDWRIFREDHAIAVRAGGGKSAPRLARSWAETGLPDPLLRLVREVAKYAAPSPIQMAAIPAGLARRDMIGLAETGSGKTAAFVLPLLVHIAGCPPLAGARAADGPYGLVLAPTRELAQQIEAEATRFARPLGLRVTAVVGGLAIEAQGTALRAGAELVVATPGRLVDCLDRRYCVLAQCRYLVLDEADRMVDMGFEPQVRTILDAMPADSRVPLGAAAEAEAAVAAAAAADGAAAAPAGGGSAPTTGGALRRAAAVAGGGGEDDMEPAAPSDSTRLTFMFSATMPPVVERLTRQFLYRPMTVAVGETGRSATAVEQRVEYFSTDARKRQRLAELLRKLEPPIIVFANTKKSVDGVARAIDADTGIRTVVLHSGKAQDAREESLAAFKSGRVAVLVATDVLGRGIDIEGVAHVINFEIPQKIEQYTHRIGRTGRAGRTGVAWSLATAEDKDIFFDLKARLEAAGAHVPPELAKGAGRRAAAGGSAFGSAIID